MVYSIEKMPQKGFVLAYFRDGLVFEPYEVRNGMLLFDGCERLQKEDPTECHFFDRHQDYHRVCRQARHDVVEYVATEEEEARMEKDLLFVEDVLVKEEYVRRRCFPEKLRIINRYRYSENDVLVLKDYRISWPG